MIPAAFEYRVPDGVDEAIGLLRDNPGEAKLLAGGHSLVPMMKLRLASPGIVVDLRRLRGALAYIREDSGNLRIGALTTHAEVAASEVVRSRCPLLAETAATIADIQVRNRGTLGGSIAHADPAADYPAALLALNAEITVRGPGGSRTVAADELLFDAFFTHLGDDEMITEVVVPTYGPSTGGVYHKFANKASHFAIVGVASTVRLDRSGRVEQVTVAITGAGPRATRARAVEEALRGESPTPAAIEEAATHAAEGIECLSDLHAQADYREHLCRVFTQRAVRDAAARAQLGV
ncbi:MAG: xanthine dehydrogenase family protein subunit M [Chloroflexi bacterium]|nr:xanthine dehydrogenase family protein subunit M [Chloroflexota bacterium]